MMSEIDAYFDRLRVGTFGSSDPNVVPQQGIAVGDGNVQPAPFMANVPATVVIDDTGLAITNGKLTVTNPSGTVIIDGTSDMFRIVATGTLLTASAVAGSSVSAAVAFTTGLTYPPAFLAYLDFAGGVEGLALPGGAVNTGGRVKWQPRSGYSGTDTYYRVDTINDSSVDYGQYNSRYYILKQVAL